MILGYMCMILLLHQKRKTSVMRVYVPSRLSVQRLRSVRGARPSQCSAIECVSNVRCRGAVGVRRLFPRPSSIWLPRPVVLVCSVLMRVGHPTDLDLHPDLRPHRERRGVGGRVQEAHWEARRRQDARRGEGDSVCRSAVADPDDDEVEGDALWMSAWAISDRSA